MDRLRAAAPPDDAQRHETRMMHRLHWLINYARLAHDGHMRLVPFFFCLPVALQGAPAAAERFTLALHGQSKDPEKDACA